MKIIIGFANQIIYLMANLMLSQSGQKQIFIQIHPNNDESVCASQSAEPNLILLNILTEWLKWRSFLWQMQESI